MSLPLDSSNKKNTLQPPGPGSIVSVSIFVPYATSHFCSLRFMNQHDVTMIQKPLTSAIYNTVST
jgi:hypothetical protein